MIAFEDLNRIQAEAVQWNDGPLLVLAGPGSGKTAVLTFRVARLLQQNENASVLALTFTNKAANEMRDRVEQLLRKRTERASLCTFHSFAARLLMQHGSHIGIQSDFDLLTYDRDRIAILEEVVRSLSIRQHQLPDDYSNLLRLVDQLFSESYTGEGPFPPLPASPEWLPSLFGRYCDALVTTNHLDFGSLLYFANRLLREKPAIAELMHIVWPYICVDEFQDTNRAQYDLLRLIAPERDHKLFVVADDDQLIYHWNGARLQCLSDLSRDYNLQTIQLPENYRCPPEIVSRANRLILHNTERLIKSDMVSQRQGRSSSVAVRWKMFHSLAEEAGFIAQDIRVRGLISSDCVVLGRTNHLLKCIAQKLQNFGQDAHVHETKGNFDSPALGVMLAAMRLADLRHDRVVLQGICREWHRVTGKVIEPGAVEGEAALVGGDFLRAWANIAGTHDVGGDDYLLRMIRENLVDRLDFLKFIEQFIAHSRQSFNGQDDQGESALEEVQIWEDLHQNILRAHNGILDLHTYLQALNLSSKIPIPTPGSLQCMTVHRSKGLQFKHVYLIGMSQGVFPFSGARHDPGMIEEERRLCFVAVTRAQLTLTLTWSREYFGVSRMPSQFVQEMGMRITASEPNPSLRPEVA